MRLLKLSRSNREAVLEELWNKLQIEAAADDLISRQYDWLQRSVQEAAAGKASLAANHIADGYLNLAMAARRRSNSSESEDYLRKSFAYVYWSRELNVLARLAPDWYELSGDDLLMPLLLWQALAPACGSPWFALWIAPHIHNQFAYPDDKMPVAYFSLDKPARRFMQLVQRSLITREWPSEVDFHEMAGYGELLRACGRPVDWSAALVDFCDWRLANALGYPEMGATKRRRQSAMWSMLDAESIEKVLPAELLTLRFAYERATGQTLSLDAPHPILQNAMMTLPFPSVEPMYQDAWTAKLIALREVVNTADLPLVAEIKAKFV